jgi:hypothetical protein
VKEDLLSHFAGNFGSEKKKEVEVVIHQEGKQGLQDL